jgi:hypothetical protein
LPSRQVALLPAALRPAEAFGAGVAGAVAKGEAGVAPLAVTGAGVGLFCASLFASAAAPSVEVLADGLVVDGVELGVVVGVAGAVTAGVVVALAFSFLRSPMASALALPMAKTEIKNTGASLRIWDSFRFLRFGEEM